MPPVFFCVFVNSAFSGSAYGANVGTGAAVYTSVSVDNILTVALGNSIYGALISTSTARDAIVRNLISHEIDLLVFIDYIVAHRMKKSRFLVEN